MELNMDLAAKIRIEHYKTGDRHVFSVYRGDRNWKRLGSGKGGKSPEWVERHLGGPNTTASAEDKHWLNHVWKDSDDYRTLERFPRERGQLSVPSLDLLTWEDIPRIDPSQVGPTNWLIESFLPEGSIQLVFGERGAFKSTLLLFAAGAVANGEPFLGMKTLPTRVLVLDHENPASIIGARNDDLSLNLPTNPNLAIWDRFGPYPIPRPGDLSLETLVQYCIRDTGRGPWIIFDSWTSLLRPGEGGEFTGQIAPLYLHLRRLTDLGATITIVDHTRKNDRSVLYGGQDKEAKADSIHNLLLIPNKAKPHEPIIRVESWLKRYAPDGEGSFAFQVQSARHSKGDWHITGLVPAGDPAEAELRGKVRIISKLILQNPNLGQEALARRAIAEGMSRDQAIAILKDGTGKHWRLKKTTHNKSSYSVL